jgi:hypothetical protein
VTTDAAEVPGPALEGYRAAPRGGFLRILLPGLIASTLGYLTIAGASVLGQHGERASAIRIGSTLPRAAVVDEAGHPYFDAPVPLAAYALTVLGGLIVLAGPVLLVRRLRGRGDDEEAELSLCRGALVFRDHEGQTTVPWAEVREVRAEPGDDGAEVVTLTRHDGSEVRLTVAFAGIGTQALAARIRAVRGRALFGLLDDAARPERHG